MIEKTLSTKLADCLDWMEETGADPKEAASRHPGQSKELLHLLQTAAQLKSAQKPHPSKEFRSVARTRLLNQIEAADQSHVTNGQASRHIWRNTNQAGRQAAFQPTHKRRFAMTWMLVIGMIASLLVGGGGVAYASGDALPGDALYPVKTTLQDLELVFSSDLEDINHLMEHMSLNLAEMQQLATQKRYQDIQLGLGEYQENLQALVRTRARISYEDSGSEDSLNTRLQQQLQTQTKLLENLQQQLQSQDQLQLQQQIQEAIQLTEVGNTYGPNEGGQPEESGEPNGAGPGEPQGDQNQAEEGKPDDAGSGSCEGLGPNGDCTPGDGEPNNGPGDQEGAGGNNGGDGQGPKDDSGGSGKGPGGKP